MMRRREFIEKTTAAGTLVGLSGLALNSCTSDPKKQLTILHTNDVHSHIDVFPKHHSRYPNLGGLARRATLVEQIRQENPNTLLFDAGDIFQGTPYFNFYGGELEFKLMSKLKYDAATIGNHDFDNGLEGLLAQMPHASFKMLSANYDFSNIYKVDGLKIGVYGLGIKLQGLVTKKLYQETEYLNPYELAQDMERVLKIENNCDLVICLSHLGYDYENEDRPSDIGLASKTDFTDLIIGGHTHTFLDKPSIVKNRKGNDILVNQVGCFGINLGRVDFYFDSAKNASADGISILI